MKKILCLLMAVLTVGALASCTLFKDHDDGICDLCDSKLIVTKNEEGNKELCAECWLKELADDINDEIQGN